MAFNYKPLWKLLIDKDMTKKQLMGRGEQVSLEILDRICTLFNCKIEDVIEHI